MWRAIRSVLFFSAFLMLASADDGWRRLDTDAIQPSRSSHWGRSDINVGGSRVPFAPEDIALPPPWLLPHQEKPVGFPAAQAQVRSFFDEEPIEWPPRPAQAKQQQQQQPKPQIQSQTARQHQQQPVQQPPQHQVAPPPVIHTSLQPPRAIPLSSTIKPVQHIWYEPGERHPASSAQRSRPAEARVNHQQQQQVAHHQQVLTASVTVGAKSREPSVAQASAAQQQVEPKSTAKSDRQRHQNNGNNHSGNDKKQTAATAATAATSSSRKSVKPSYDSSEYEYEEEAAAAAAAATAAATISGVGHQDKKTINPKSGYQDDREDEQAELSLDEQEEDFYGGAPSKRHRQQPGRYHPEQHRNNANKDSAEQSELERHQSFDSGRTIFRNQVNSGNQQQQQRFRPAQPNRPPVFDEEQDQPRDFIDQGPSPYGDDDETERYPTKPNKGQPGVRRQPQQQQQQRQKSPERNPTAPEAPSFEAERPNFFSPSNLQAPHNKQHQFERHQQQQQQHNGEWPARQHGAPDAGRKNKPRNPYRPSAADEPNEGFGGNNNNNARNKARNPAAGGPSRYPEDQREEPQDHQQRDHHADHPRAPYAQQPPPYRPIEDEDRPNYDQHHQPEEYNHHQPAYEEQDQQQQQQYQPEEPNHRPRRPPTEPGQSHARLPNRNQHPEAESNSYDPFEEHRENHQQPEEQPQHELDHHQPGRHEEEEDGGDRRPAISGRRPLPQQHNSRPSSSAFPSADNFDALDQSGNSGDSNDDNDFHQPGHSFNNGPPQRPHHPQGNRQQRPNRPPPPPPHHRPRDSVVTQGLNTLKSLVGLQSPPPRRHPPHSFGPDGRRPEGHRPDGHGGRPGGRRPPPQHHDQDPFGGPSELGRLDQSENTDEYDMPSFSSAFKGRPHLKSLADEPMEHRSEPEEEDLAPAATASTESAARVTTQANRVVSSSEAPVAVASSTAAPEEPKSSLFPPFSKRVRPQKTPSATPTSTSAPAAVAQPEVAKSLLSSAKDAKDGSMGQLRITSYKQRIEAMKERARLREQQQQQAQSKKDTDDLEPSDSAAPKAAESVSTTTSSTTVRPSTTRPKVPPRMPVRKPVTSAASQSTTSTTTTTESAPVARSDKHEESEAESNFEQYKRRFKPKSSFSRRPVKEEEDPIAPSAVSSTDGQNQEADVPAGKKNLFGKLPGGAFGRRRFQQQQQQQQEEQEQRQQAEEKAKSVDKEEAPSMSFNPVKLNKENSKRRPSYSRTSTAPPTVDSSSDVDVEESPIAAALPEHKVTQKPADEAKFPDDDESPKIELVGVTSVGDDKNHQPPKEEDSYDPFEAAAHHSSLSKPEDAEARLSHAAESKRHPFFAMATNDPILPIEELLNIRVRDNGKDM